MRSNIKTILMIVLIFIHKNNVFANQDMKNVNSNVDVSKDIQPEKSEESISKGRYITGGITGSIIGFGLGHTIQGRYRSNRAWIFTAGEGAIAAYFLYGNLFGSSYCSRNSESNGCLVFPFFEFPYKFEYCIL